jgi:hypothetical protein
MKVRLVVGVLAVAVRTDPDGSTVVTPVRNAVQRVPPATSVADDR